MLCGRGGAGKDAVREGQSADAKTLLLGLDENLATRDSKNQKKTLPSFSTSPRLLELRSERFAPHQGGPQP